MIQKGLSKSLDTGIQWIPSPGEFCEWCKPCAEDYGLPSKESAFTEARNESAKALEFRRWSHDVVRIAASNTGYHELKTLADNSPRYRDVSKAFCAEYDSLANRFMSGETFTVPATHRIEMVKVDHNDPRHKKAGESVIGSLKGMFDDV